MVPCWTPAGYRAPLPCCGLQTGQWKSPESSIFSADTGDCMILWFRQISTINTVPETTTRVTHTLTFVTHRTYNLLLAGVAISEYFFIGNIFYLQNRIFYGWYKPIKEYMESGQNYSVHMNMQWLQCAFFQQRQLVVCTPKLATKAILLIKCRLLLLKKLSSNSPFHTFWDQTSGRGRVGQRLRGGLVRRLALYPRSRHVSLQRITCVTCHVSRGQCTVSMFVCKCHTPAPGPAAPAPRRAQQLQGSAGGRHVRDMLHAVWQCCTILVTSVFFLQCAIF